MKIRPFKTRRSQSNSSTGRQRASCGIEFTTDKDKSPDTNSKKSSKRSKSQELNKSGDYLDSLMDKMISKSLLIINESSNTDNEKFPIQTDSLGGDVVPLEIEEFEMSPDDTIIITPIKNNGSQHFFKEYNYVPENRDRSKNAKKAFLSVLQRANENENRMMIGQKDKRISKQEKVKREMRKQEKKQKLRELYSKYQTTHLKENQNMSEIEKLMSFYKQLNPEESRLLQRKLKSMGNNTERGGSAAYHSIPGDKILGENIKYSSRELKQQNSADKPKLNKL